jgi:hypothetical protein
MESLPLIVIDNIIDNNQRQTRHVIGALFLIFRKKRMYIWSIE